VNTSRPHTVVSDVVKANPWPRGQILWPWPQTSRPWPRPDPDLESCIGNFLASPSNSRN